MCVLLTPCYSRTVKSRLLVLGLFFRTYVKQQKLYFTRFKLEIDI